MPGGGTFTRKLIVLILIESVALGTVDAAADPGGNTEAFVTISPNSICAV